MPSRSVFGLLLAVAAAVAIGWGAGRAAVAGSCRGDDAVPCPPGMGLTLVVLLVGVAAAVVAGLLVERLAVPVILLAGAAGCVWAGAARSDADAAPFLVGLGGLFGLIGLALLAHRLLPRFRADDGQ